MAQFEARNAQATFFITGNNNGKGAVDEKWRSVVTNMYNKGHQIASHTWSHQDLSVISQGQRYDQMIKNEMAIQNIIGKYPTYMRPPYSSCNDACQAVLVDLGYVITSFNLDTDDYNQLTKEKIQIAKDNFKNGIDTAGAGGEKLAIAHDIHELTALNLTGFMLDYVYSQGFTAVTVGECMNDPPANWYRDSTPAAPGLSSGRSSSPIPSPTGAVSKNGACGVSNANGGGQTCIGFIGPDGLNECNSQYVTIVMEPNGVASHTDFLLVDTDVVATGYTIVDLIATLFTESAVLNLPYQCLCLLFRACQLSQA
jgi:hypothetical protein